MNNEKGHLDKSIIDIRKNVGKVVIEINEDMIMLQRAYKLVKPQGKKLEGKDAVIENKVIESSENLKSTLQNIKDRADFACSEELRKVVKLISTTLETAQILLGSKGYENVSENDLKNAKEDARLVLDEGIKEVEKSEEQLDYLLLYSTNNY